MYIYIFIYIYVYIYICIYIYIHTGRALVADSSQERADPPFLQQGKIFYNSYSAYTTQALYSLYNYCRGAASAVYALQVVCRGASLI